jgi:AraC-like DNA-binding protein
MDCLTIDILRHVMKILATHLKGFIDYALLQGLSSQDLLTVLKVNSFPFEDPTAKVTSDEFYAIVEMIALHTKDQCMGIRVGQQLNLNTLGVVYKISRKTRTMMEALHYCHDFLEKTFPAIHIERTRRKDSNLFVLTMKSKNILVSQIILEALLCVMEREIKIIAGEKVKTTIHSPFVKKDYPKNWKFDDQFKIQFNCRELLLNHAEHWKIDALIPEYLALIEEMKVGKSFLDIVKITALNMARPKLPSLEMISYNLNMTTRTLQRKLTQKGSSYRKLLKELKRDISDLLLRHEQFSIVDVSTILGYAEPASFIHSFNKWHGTTPSQWRKSTLASK